MAAKPTALLYGLLFLIALGTAEAGETHLAVAANFTAPMKRLAEAFERESGHKTLLSFGATGRFHAQIGNGAPFDILLAADAETPAKLEREKLAVPGSRFTYAIGRLVLWSPRPDFVDARGEVLKTGVFGHLALAAPKLAPYGAAAVATLNAMDLFDRLQPTFVQGENIAQTHQFVTTGNAELGFVALSQVYENGQLKSGSAWIVPEGYYPPIRQEAVLLQKGRENPAATAFLSFLQTDAARSVIHAFGYAPE
ncbi:MAG: molybdate ABC transporter substrate-binding protein [Magnetococcales bacterium]|nr:molybdate ABC transporter substrate-binding protein [Magnetococcales bacterium]